MWRWRRAGEKIVVLGVPPTRAETGYGYIELGAVVDSAARFGSQVAVRRVKRFTEKPDAALAEEFVASGNYAWNSGMFLWSARTLADAIREHQSGDGAAAGEDCRGVWDVERSLSGCLRRCIRSARTSAIDYAVLEPRSAKGEERAEIYCLPGDFAWNDLGSWSALHEHAAGVAPEKARSRMCSMEKSALCVDRRRAATMFMRRAR